MRFLYDIFMLWAISYTFYTKTTYMKSVSFFVNELVYEN